MTTETDVACVKVDDLVFDPENPRLHPEDNLDQIKQSLETFGQVELLVVQRSRNMVISGNGRLAAMRAMGTEVVNVMYVDWDDARARAYSLVANRTAETSKWDADRVADHLADVGENFDLQHMGFDESFIQSIQDDFQPPTEAETPEPDANADRPKHGKPVQLTREQRDIFDQACARVRESGNEDYSEGRCLELMAGDYMAGA